MGQQIIPSDLQVQGRLACSQFYPPAGSITPPAIAGGVGNYHGATNFQQQFQKEYKISSATAVASDQQVIHVVRGATATLLDVVIGAIVAAIGAATVTLDLWKNGSSVLTSTVNLTSATAAYGTVSPTINTVACVAGDVLEVKLTATAGGGTLPKGVFVRLALREDPN